VADVDGATASIALSGDWVARTDGVEAGAARRILQPQIRSLRFDADGLGHWDSGLIAFLLDLRNAATRGGVAFDEGGLPAPARRLLTLVSNGPAPAPARPAVSFLARTGLGTLSVFAETTETAALIGDLFLRSGVALRGGAMMRVRDLVDRMCGAGAAALPIVTVVNVLMGGILAFIGVTELRDLGAGIYVANLVALGMVREMAPLMTAIIMCGRTGGAYAANIAAMQGAEEVDALRAFGIPVFDYLILPRVAALTCMMPLLFIYGCALGIAGGLLVGATTLGAPAASFFETARESLSLQQLGFGLAKSVAFGALIAIVACRVGLRASRSASAVGNAATSAVVAGIVGVIALDAMFDLCANVLGI
jgi:phospholipid/cholesterol/gamma-HCH transport system permease protein